jgi:hypothetical protein
MKPTMSNFFDGLTSFINQLANRRNTSNTNQITTKVLQPAEARAIYKTGIGSKIVRLKTGYALDDTIQFKTKEQEVFYNRRLAKAVKRAARFQLGFGRGIIVIQEPNADLSKPLLSSVDISKAQLKVFSGDMVTSTDVNRDLNERRYYKPNFYTVRGFQIHYSRVIDFTYVEPPELDAPSYQYGGISEFELIHAQLVNQAVVERASAFIIERNSTLFYKVKDFKQQLAQGKESPMLEYFSRLEDARSIYGAGIVDADDTVETHAQALTNLSEASMISLKMLSMVTGISLTELVGESAAGLNSSGKNEQTATIRMVEAYQSGYLLDPINELMSKFKKGEIEFKDNQEPTAGEQVDYEKTVIENATLLANLGEDYEAYLTEKGISISEDAFTKIFNVETVEALGGAELGAEDEPGEVIADPADPLAVDPQSALNGAQVTALLDVIAQVTSGLITKSVASQILQTAFPISAPAADLMLRDVIEGTPAEPELEAVVDSGKEEEI